MSITCSGTVVGGALQLDQRLAFADQTLVDVSIADRSAESLEKNHAQWRHFLQAIEVLRNTHPTGSEGHRLTRDELYDRR